MGEAEKKKATMPAGKQRGIDDPLDEVSDDDYSLGQASFHLANVLAALENRGAQIIAINAPWGAGKTSLINLTKRLFDKDGPLSDESNSLKGYLPLRYDETSIAKIRAKDLPNLNYTFVDFNAWLEGGEHSIVIAICDIIVDTLNNDDGEVMTATKRFWRNVKRNPGGYFKGGVAFINFASYLQSTVQDSGDSSGAQTSANAGASDLTNIASELEKAQKELLEGDKHFVLIIDDIDRMPPERLQELFSALWTVKDMAKITFLLLYDHEQVVDSLSRTMFRSIGEHNERGAANQFLEKIVQYSFQVPLPTPNQLLLMLETSLIQIDGLNDCFPGSPSDGKFRDELRWHAIRKLILHDLVKTPRAVKRLATTIGFSWPMRNFIPIDPRDMVAIEAIRLFDSKLFKTIEKKASKIELNSPDPKPWKPEKNAKNDKLALLFPGHYTQAYSDQDQLVETKDSIASRRGFGSPQLMSHYLQGIPIFNISVLYNIESFFQSRHELWKEQLILAHEEDHLPDLCMKVLNLINTRQLSGRSNKTNNDLSTSLTGAAKEFSKESAEYKNFTELAAIYHE